MIKALGLTAVTLISTLTSGQVQAQVWPARLNEPVVACDTVAGLLDFYDMRDSGKTQEFLERTVDALKNNQHIHCRSYKGRVLVLTSYSTSYCIKELGPDEYPNEAVCYRIPKGYLMLDTMTVKDGEALIKGETTEAKIYRKQAMDEIYHRH